MMWQEFEISKYDSRRPIVIYGAGIFGEYTLRALQEHGLEPVCFCDRAKSGKMYLEYNVYEYDFIKTLNDPVILLAVGAAFHDAYSFLTKMGFNEIYSIGKFCFKDTTIPLEKLSIQGQDIKFYEKLYQFGIDFKKDDGKFRMYSIDWVITERCSLKCKECSNLMQYYKSPENIETEKLISSMNKLLSVVDEIMDVRVIGGEPFMNPEIAKIMGAFIKDDRIKNFSIYTNATILPNEEMITIMKNNKVKCEISNYGPIARNYNKFIEIMKRENIRYRIVELTEWHKLGGLYDRNSSIENMRKTFAKCYCNDLITMLDEKIYRCPYSAHGRMLEAIPYNEEDVIDLNCSEKYLKSKLYYMIHEKDFDYACGYCDGRNYHLATVPPAVQIKDPLEYKKINE